MQSVQFNSKLREKQMPQVPFINCPQTQEREKKDQTLSGPGGVKNFLPNLFFYLVHKFDWLKIKLSTHRHK